MRPIALLLCCLGLLSCPSSDPPIARALHFLAREQVEAPTDHVAGLPGTIDYTGDWPQFFYFRHAPEARFRDVSPFMPAYVYDALTYISDGSVETLGLARGDAQEARCMRKRAIAFMRRFAARATDPDVGTFGFWPYWTTTGAGNPRLEQILLRKLVGPRLGGTRGPINLPFYPREMLIPSDADVTAVVYADLLADEALDGASPTPAPLDRIFGDWRDVGAVPLRVAPSWLPNASGAFLTWLSYHEPPNPAVPNDVDLVVNANVLFALARYGRFDARGTPEAIALINDFVRRGLHHTHHDEVILYYPDNYAFEFAVTRAYWAGQEGLRPAADILADEIEAAAITDGTGVAHWDRGSPHLNTALALLALLRAGRHSVLVDEGVTYLLDQQDPVLGCWDEAPFFVAHTDGGQQIEWVSRSFTTAMCLEALCVYESARTN